LALILFHTNKFTVHFKQGKSPTMSSR